MSKRTPATPPPARDNALEQDPRFARFAELYVEHRGNGHKAALLAGYPKGYAKSHAHKLVARLKLKAGPVLRAAGIDEVRLAGKLNQLLEARAPKWNPKRGRWDQFAEARVQQAAVEVGFKLLDAFPATRLAGPGGEAGEAIPVRIVSSIPRPER